MRSIPPNPAKNPKSFCTSLFEAKAKELCELKLDEMKNAEKLTVLGSYDDITSSENEQRCPFNGKCFQRKVCLALKCKFNKPNLSPIDASRSLIKVLQKHLNILLGGSFKPRSITTLITKVS